MFLVKLLFDINTQTPLWIEQRTSFFTRNWQESEEFRRTLVTTCQISKRNFTDRKVVSRISFRGQGSDFQDVYVQARAKLDESCYRDRISRTETNSQDSGLQAGTGSWIVWSRGPAQSGISIATPAPAVSTTSWRWQWKLRPGPAVESCVR